MSHISVLAFEAAIQRKLALIQAQRLTPIDPYQPVLQKKGQALLHIMPLIPFLDQLVTDYNQYMPVYNDFIEHMHTQLTPDVMQHLFYILQALHYAIIKEQGLCWAQLDTLLQWWIQKPYAKQKTFTQTEMKLFHYCHQFVKHLPQLAQLNNDITSAYAQPTHKLKQIFFQNPHIRQLHKKEDQLIDTMKQQTTEILEASDELRKQTSASNIIIYLKFIHDIDINWTQHCVIHHP